LLLRYGPVPPPPKLSNLPRLSVFRWAIRSASRTAPATRPSSST
jgi:hypothetical protein